MRKSRSRATARKPVLLSLAGAAFATARIRDPHEHDQREDSVGEAVEEVERLERAEVTGGSDDEARDRRAAAETEVACDSAERDRGGAVLRWDQGQGQNLVRGGRDSEPGAADGCAGEGLPGTVDECEARVAQCAREIAGDQDRLRAETIEQRTRQGRDDRRRAHDRRQHQPRGRRREAAGLVQVDDLEGKDQSSAEGVDRGPGLKNDDRPRQARPPAGEHTTERPAHSLPAGGCFPVLPETRAFTSAPGGGDRERRTPRARLMRTIPWVTFQGRFQLLRHDPAGGSSGQSVVHTPRHRETGRPRAAQFAARAVYIPGGGTTWRRRKERRMATADLLSRDRRWASSSSSAISRPDRGSEPSSAASR